MINQTVREYVEKIRDADNEIRLLRDDKKAIDDEYRSKLDLKAVKAAIRISKIKDDSKTDHDIIDQVLLILESESDD